MSDTICRMASRRSSPVPPVALEPKAYLVPRSLEKTVREWPKALPQRGLYKVTGAPGSGVSSFLLDTAAAAIRARGSDLSEADGAGGAGVCTPRCAAH